MELTLDDVVRLVLREQGTLRLLQLRVEKLEQVHNAIKPLTKRQKDIIAKQGADLPWQ